MKYWRVIIVVLVAAAAGFILILKLTGGSTPSSTITQNTTCSSASSAVLTYQNNNFSPACVKLKSGTVVTWRNNSKLTIEIGADPHPSHTGNRDLSGGAFVLTIPPHASQQVTMRKLGEHGYHNHLNPDATGTIIVQ